MRVETFIFYIRDIAPGIVASGAEHSWQVDDSEWVGGKPADIAAAAAECRLEAEDSERLGDKPADIVAVAAAAVEQRRLQVVVAAYKRVDNAAAAVDNVGPAAVGNNVDRIVVHSFAFCVRVSKLIDWIIQLSKLSQSKKFWPTRNWEKHK